MHTVLYAIAAVIVLVVLIAISVKRMVVWEPFVGLLYRNGKYLKKLQPGMYYLIRPFYKWDVRLYDLRKKVINVPGQELLTSDNVGIKVSVAVVHNVENPETAENSSESYMDFLYNKVQLALRTAVAKRTIEELLEKRDELNAEILAEVKKEMEPAGLAVHQAEVKDVMFPGELKKIFNEVIRARKEGQAALEKARGETAALRNLANAAKMLENNPQLMNLRVLQAISNASSGAGNTFVLGVPQGLVPLSEEKKSSGTSESE